MTLGLPHTKVLSLPQPTSSHEATAGPQLLRTLSRHKLCMWASHTMGLSILLCKLGQQKSHLMRLL